MATNKDFKVKNGVTAGGAVTGSNLSGTNTGDQTIALTGDVTGSGTGSFGATLASTGVSAGTYSSVAVDVKGRVTAGAALVGDVTTSAGTATLASVGTSGTKGSASAVPVFVTDTKGRVTSSADTAIQIAETQVTDGSLLARNAGNETISGNWTFSNVVVGADPTLSAHLATKQYVDNIASGLDVKSSVRAASTTNLTLSGTQTVDGVALIAGDRVLAKDQTTGANNGIYVVASGAWTRSSDADASAEVTTGLYTFVEEGTANADTGWLLTTVAPITLGTTSLSFAQFTGLGQVTAGAGLSKTGSTLSLNTTLAGLSSVTSTTFVGALTGNASTVTTNANLTGDVTSVGNATTLATVNSNTGALGSSTAIPTITTNGKGLVTAVTTNAVVAPAGTLTGSTLASGVTGSSLTSVGTLTGLAVSTGSTTGASITTSGAGAATGSLSITDTGGNGANLKLAGNGSTTPNKFLRAFGGKLEFVNSSYAAVIASIDDTGTFTSNSAATGALSVASIASSGPATVIDSLLAAFTQSGTGAVARSARDKLRERASAFDFMTAAQIADVTAGTLTLDVTAALNAALASGAMVVHVPTGGYLITGQLTVPDGVLLQGQGANETVIHVSGSGYDALNLSGNYSSVQDTGFFSASSRSSGRTAYVSGLTRGNGIRNCRFQNQFIAIEIGSASPVITWIDQCEFLDTTPTTGVTINIVGGNDTFITRCVADASPSAQPLAGVRIVSTQAVWISDCDFIHQNIGLAVTPGTGQVITWCFFHNTAFDTCATDGIQIFPSGTGSIRGLFFTGCWTSTNSLRGVLVQKASGASLDGVFFSDHKSLNNGNQGIYVASVGCYNVNLVDSVVSGNSGASSGTYAGIEFAAGATYFTVSGGRSGTMLSFGNSQSYGVLVNSGASDIYTITGVNVEGNVTADLFDGGTGTNKHVFGNLGATSSTSSLGTAGSLTLTSTNSTGSLIIADTGTSGANLKLIGNGSTTPNKYVRAFNGKLSVVNSAYTTEIASIDDSGNLIVAGNLTSSGTSSAVNWLQSGTGAVTRTMSSKLQDVVSAKDFGATGDGSTDDTAAIQAAINFVQSHTNVGSSVSPYLGPQVLYIPAGYYFVSAPLTITGAITIRGDKSSEFSSGTRLHKTTAGDLFTCTAAGGGLSFSLEELCLDSTGVSGSGYLVNMVSGSQNHNSSRLYHCVFSNPQNFAIRATADDLHIDTCTFDVSPFNSIQLGSLTGSDICSDLLVSNCNWYNITDTIFLAYQYRNVRITGCQVSNPTTPIYTKHFFDAATGSPSLAIGLSITGCCMDFVRQILALSNTSNTCFTGNSCYGVGNGSSETLDSILLTNTNVDVAITGNVISGSYGTKSAINNTGGGNLNALTVTGNVFRSAGSLGTALTLGAGVGIVMGNYYNGFLASLSSSNSQVISGNAGTATALQTARTINGTSFDGTANITVTAAAGTLTGTTLASGVTGSSLTSVGTLGSLALASTNSTGTLVITDAGSSGANIKLAGDGATTPNKYVRAQGGKLSVVNSAYSSEIASVDDSGNLVAAGGMTAQAGNVTANGFVPTSSTVVSNGMYLIAANTLAFSTNGAEKARLDPSGNLGVLTLTPPSPLSVALNQGGSFSVGSSWSNRSAVIGVATSGSSGNLGFAYDNTQGASIISIEPSVAWHPIGYHASQHNFGVSGNATAVIGSNGLGYAAGAGSAVTQGTSRGTNVTINAVCGAITMFSAAGFSTAPTSFTVTNSKVAATDTVVLSQKSGTNQYVLLVSAVAAGSFTITFYTAPGQTATDAPVINFAVIKAVAS